MGLATDRAFRTVSAGHETNRPMSDADLAARERAIQLNDLMEQQSRRVAQSLHDEAGQLLAAVHLKLDEIFQRLEPSCREPVLVLKAMLNGVEEQLRRLAHELRSSILDDFGL